MLNRGSRIRQIYVVTDRLYGIIKFIFIFTAEFSLNLNLGAGESILSWQINRLANGLDFKFAWRETKLMPRLF